MLRWVNAHKSAAVGVVAAIALIAGGFLARRANTEPTPPATTTTTAAATGASSPATPTPVATAVAAAAAGDDPGRLDFPVDPSGARDVRSEDGVRQVGLDYLATVQQRFLYLTPAAGRDLLEVWRADGVAAAELDRTVQRFDNLRTVLTAAGGDVWWLVSPLAVRVDAYNLDRARVSVWTATITASSADPATGGDVVVPIVDYRISTVELLWSDGAGGWSVWSVSDAAGPVPMLAAGAVVSAPSEFLARLDGFALVKEHH